jgi:GTP1/Obg family GTP-binding protein
VDEKVASEASAKVQQAPSLDKIDPTMMQMIKTMFDGFHVLIDLELDGKIVKTNADYVAGSRITLLEVDMNSVLADQGKLSVLQSKIKPGVSLSELRPYLKDIQGVKVNHPTVTIEYR